MSTQEEEENATEKEEPTTAIVVARGRPRVYSNEQVTEALAVFMLTGTFRGTARELEAHPLFAGHAPEPSTIKAWAAGSTDAAITQRATQEEKADLAALAVDAYRKAVERTIGALPTANARDAAIVAGIMADKYAIFTGLGAGTGGEQKPPIIIALGGDVKL